MENSSGHKTTGQKIGTLIGGGLFSSTFIWIGSPISDLADVAHRLLTKKEFAASFQDGAFQHLHDSMAGEYRQSLFNPLKWGHRIKLHKQVIEELKASGITRQEAFQAHTLLGKLLGIGLTVTGIIAAIATIKSVFFPKDSSSSEKVVPAVSARVESQEPPTNLHTQRLLEQEKTAAVQEIIR